MTCVYNNTYTDIDECAQNVDDCSGGARCNNLVGSFECLCPSGFTGDGRTCTGDHDGT